MSSKVRWDQVDDDATFLDLENPVIHREKGRMPVASDAKAKAASKETWRGRRATKRVAQVTSGIRHRRKKKVL